MSFKSYKIETKIEGDLLRYYVTGERSVEAAIELWEKIYQDCEEHQIFKVYSTVLLSGRIDAMSIPLVIRALVELNANRPITCAWVDLNQESYNDNLMGEKMPRPEEMNIRIFNNHSDAERWLATQD